MNLIKSFEYIDNCCSFRRRNYEITNIVFFLKKIHERHIDENMIVMMLITFDEYEIRNFFDYFVMNNAESNDIIITILSKTFKKDDIAYDSIEHRLRYIDHIINLSIQFFLFDKHSNVEYDIIIDISVDRKLNEKLQKYRKLKLQNKFHNIIIHIMYSFQRI